VARFRWSVANALALLEKNLFSKEHIRLNKRDGSLD
jgi:hypothetical protein